MGRHHDHDLFRGLSKCLKDPQVLEELSKAFGMVQEELPLPAAEDDDDDDASESGASEEDDSDDDFRLDKPGDLLRSSGKRLAGGSEMEAIRKAANSEYEAATMVLSKRDNHFDARVIFETLNPLSLKQAQLIREVKTPQESVDHAASRSCGAYLEVVKAVLSILGNSSQVSRCGMDAFNNYGIVHSDMHACAARMTTLAFSAASRLTLQGEFHKYVPPHAWAPMPCIDLSKWVTVLSWNTSATHISCLGPLHQSTPSSARFTAMCFAFPAAIVAYVLSK